MLIKEIKYLIRKEFLLEWRQKYALGGVLVYVLSTVFVCYLSFKKVVEVPTWNALLWIILLFTAVNAISKSFIQESGGKRLYLYTLVSPQAIILSKIIYNSLLVAFLSLICFACYALFIGNPVADHGLFFLALLLGGIGFSSTLTMMAAISAQTNNNATMMAILSFPIILPLLLVLITLSKNAVDGLAWSVNIKYIVTLLGLNVLVAGLSYILFPYLWRD